MIKNPGEMTARVRIQCPKTTGEGVSKRTVWIDIGGEAEEDAPHWLYAKWEGVHGAEAWAASSVQAELAATVGVWYRPEITHKCRLLDESGRVFNIISLDDVRLRHEQIELKVKASVNG